jgi:short-subunit dehydrogenase
VGDLKIRNALITGASSGIGAEFARQLASQGCNLLLVARRKERLANLAEQLSSTYAIQVDVFPADLANPDDLASLVDFISRMPELDLLINNAGFGIRGKFAELPIENHLRMIQVMVVAAIYLARAVLPGMIKQKNGAVINVASSTALITYRGNVSYKSSKSYMVMFSEALAVELRGSGVRIQALTHTEFHEGPTFESFREKPPRNFLWSTPEQVVSASLKDLQKNRVICVPGHLTNIGVWLAVNTPLDTFLRYLKLRGRSS